MGLFSGGGGGGASAMPALPPPPPPPPNPPILANASVQGAGNAQRVAAASNADATVKTGPQGVTGSTPQGKLLLSGEK